MISTLNGFVGSSIGTLHKMSSQIDLWLKEFGESERELLGTLMPNRKIIRIELLCSYFKVLQELLWRLIKQCRNVGV
jgi:hypothetical protein